MSIPPSWLQTKVTVTSRNNREIKLFFDVQALLNDFSYFFTWASGLLVTRVMPMIESEAGFHVGCGFASFTPPPLPRPPAWTWALTNDRVANSSAIFAILIRGEGRFAFRGWYIVHWNSSLA